MIIQNVTNNFLEDMLKVLEKYGNKWPPYPAGFKIPEGIKSMWDYKYYSGKNKIAILRGNFNIHGGLCIGDRFNGVVLPKKRKKSIRYSDRNHRIYQFYWKQGLLGKVVFDSPYSGDSVLEKGELIKDFVYRFEIVSINTKKRVFYCTPLKHVFNEQNLLENLINCNYQQDSNKNI